MEVRIFTKYDPPCQPSQEIQGLVFTEDVGYMSIAQQLQRFKAAGQTLADFRRQDVLSNYQFPDGNDDGSDVSFLTQNPTELDILIRRKALLDTYSDKLARSGSVESSASTLASRNNGAPQEAPSAEASATSESSN